MASIEELTRSDRDAILRDIMDQGRAVTAEQFMARERIAELEAALRVVDDDVRHHLRDSYAAPGTTIPASLIRPHAIKAVRDALKKS